MSKQSKRLEDLTEELTPEASETEPQTQLDPPVETAIDAPVEVAQPVFRRSRLREMIEEYALEHGVKVSDVDAHKLRKEHGLPNPTALWRVSFVCAEPVEPCNVEAVDESEAIRKALIMRRVARPSRVTHRVVMVAD